MDISKVVYGDTTLIDLTEDTVTADSMLSGVTAHGANGEQIYGTMLQVTPATATPLMDGTAAVGTSIKYAREDHVHPHDSSIPTKTSDLTNDSGFITDYVMSDWEEDDSTDPAYIQNKPPIKAGTGNGALLMGQAALGNQQANVINEASGANSLVLGIGNRAKGVSSTVIGQQSEAGEKYSISDGVYIRNDARFSLAMGQNIYANDRYSISIGNGYPYLFKITGAANATTYTYNTLPPQISTEVLDRTLCLGLRIAPYSISIVTAIDVNNHTVTVDRTLSETAISDVNCYIWINHGSTEYYSALIGSALETASDNQLIIGNLNRLNANAAFIIGNGVSDSNGSYPSNSTEILKDGSAWFAGTVSAGTALAPAAVTADNDLTTKAYVDDLLDDARSDWAEEDSTDLSYIKNKPNIRAGSADGSIVLNNIAANVVTGKNSLVAGSRNTVSGGQSFATGLGNTSTANRSITSGQLSRNNGGYNIVVGNGVYASDYGNYGLLVGNSISRTIKITGDANATTYTYDQIPSDIADLIDRGVRLATLSAPYIIAVVTAIDTTNNTMTVDKTLSATAVTELQVTILVGGSLLHSSLALGEGVQTTKNHQIVVGDLNELDPDALLMLGNGTLESGPSNALVVHEDGSAQFAGTVSAGTTQTPATISANNDLTTKAYVDGAVATVAGNIPTKVSDLTNDSGFVAAPSANVDEVIAYNGTTWVASKRMVILSYGSSTWTDFINAYNSNAVVYCRASSNSNPASGAQTRMAFMAYVNSATPTNVEFQYYRSVSSHTAAQQGDQVFIYKLDKTAGWSVTTRNSFTKIAVGAGLSSSYASQTLTITNTQTGLPAVTSSDNGKVLRVVSGEWAAVELPSASGVSF